MFFDFYYFRPTSELKSLGVLRFSVYMIAETASRAAFLSLVVFFITSLVSRKRKSQIGLKAVVTWGTLLSATSIILWVSEIELVARLGESFSSGRVGERAQIWLAGFQMIQSFIFFELIFGKGHGAFNFFVGNSPHNTIFGILFDYGVAGLIFFAMVLSVIFISLFRSDLPNGNLKVAITFSTIFFTLTYDPLISLDNSIAMHLFLALILVELSVKKTIV